MKLTYKNDSSFFICVKPPVNYIGTKEITKWLESNIESRYRIIVDDELEANYATLKEIDQYYPGVKTIGVTINPWARALIAYNDLQSKSHPLSKLAEGSFEEFILNLSKASSLNKFLLPQLHWFEYVDDAGIPRAVDYIFKCENLDSEFKTIQDYFVTSKPLSWLNDLPAYKEHYTLETKQIIADMFEEDIKKFNYEF